MKEKVARGFAQCVVGSEGAHIEFDQYLDGTFEHLDEVVIIPASVYKRLKELDAEVGA